MKAFDMLMYSFRVGGREIFLVWLLLIASTCLQLVLPAQVGSLTDSFKSSDTHAVSWDVVNRALLLAVAAQLGVSFLAYWTQKNLVLIEDRLIRTMATDLFSRVLRFDGSFFSGRDVESVNTRILEDSDTMMSVWAEGISTMPPKLISLLILGGFMLWMNWFLGGIMILLGTFSCYFLVFDTKIQQLNRLQRQAWDRIRVRSNETMAAVGEIRNNNAFDYALGFLKDGFRRHSDVLVTTGKWSALFSAATPFVNTLQTGTIYWVGAGMCIAGSRLAGFAGHITWGDVIQLMLVVRLYSSVAQNISIFLLTSRMGGQHIARVNELLDHPVRFGVPEESAGHTGPSDEAMEIRFENVSVTTDTNAPVLTSVNAVIRSGEHTAIVGPSGAGKSTLVQLVNPSGSPTRGAVLVAGRDIAEWDCADLARDVGFVPQHCVMFSTSIRNNILLSLRRPASSALEDENGPIDISPFERVESIDDLDRELIRVIGKVALEDDVLNKALDGLEWLNGKFGRLHEKFFDLRQRIVDAVRTCSPEMVVRFDRDRWFTEGTLGENLFGVRPVSWNFEKSEGRAIMERLRETGLLDDIVRIGVRLLSFHEVTALKHTDVWGNGCRTKRAGVASGLRVPIDGIDPDALRPELRATLMKTALKMDVGLFGEHAEYADLAVRTLAVRKRALESAHGPFQECAWPDPEEFPEYLTLREALIFGRANSRIKGARKQIDDTIRRILTDAECLEDVLTSGLEYQVGEGGKRVSGGQAQKIALARALVKRPSLIVLDEATACLDEQAQAFIGAVLREEFSGKTVVSVSHRISAIRDFDRILVMDKGRVVQQGTFEELAAQEGVFRELVGVAAAKASSEEA
ncbi:MAG: ATP-binding cassette domain-containing protein [Desulfomonilaceae bacterium]|nr:ATP-binding cassette domain-containing protein [Desulfomonilaceae bacterium]